MIGSNVAALIVLSAQLIWELLLLSPLSLDKLGLSLSASSKFCRRPATFGLSSAALATGMVGKSVVLRREGHGATATEGSHAPLFLFGELAMPWCGMCILSKDKDRSWMSSYPGS